MITIHLSMYTYENSNKNKHTMAHHLSTHKLPSSTAKLCQDLATLINNRQGSDIQFKVGGGTSTIQEDGTTIKDESATVTLYAHSLILRCRSRYFATMLDDEKNWKESSNGIIYKPNVSPGTFQDVLHYIYTGNVRAKNSENIIELIIAAEEMDLEELSIECQAELVRTVDNIFSGEDDGDDKDESGGTSEGSTRQQIPIDVALRQHIVPAINLADSHSLSYLSEKLQATVLSHISVIVNSPEAYTAFINDISFEALYKIISSDYLAMPERSVWDLALNWGCRKIEISKSAVEAQLSNPEDEEDEDEDESSNEAVISTTQLDQLKAKITPLLPAIRFSLLDSDDYHQIFGTINYFLPRRRSHKLTQFFLKPDGTVQLDTPRKETHRLKISSKITVEPSAWGLLQKTIFETGGISGCVSPNDLKFELLFRASEDGFRGITFHQRCDNKGPTLVLIKSNDGHLFGGVNFNHWKSDNTYSSSSLNFLFALPDGTYRTEPSVFKRNQVTQYSIFNFSMAGPIFGCGNGRNDLAIVDSANTSSESYSRLPISYSGSGASRTALAGAENFSVLDYEVYAISGKNETP